MLKAIKALFLSKFWILLPIIAVVTGCQNGEQLKLGVKQHARTWILKALCLEKNSHQKEAPSWMHEQIKEDLAPFSESGVTTEMIDQLWAEHLSKGNPWALLRVQITNNKITLLGDKRDDLRISYIQGGLEALVSWVSLPDVDFLITLADSLDGISSSVPIFTFANNPNFSSGMVLMPDFEVFSGRNWKLLRSVRKGNAHSPWEAKIERCIWRGGMTGGVFTPSNFLDYPRTKAITLSLQHPDIIDARFVGITQCSDAERVHAQYAPYFGQGLSIEKQIEYKYQLIIDGNSCAYSAAYWRLFSNCLTFKQQSNAMQWYYRGLSPFVHYIPVASDLSNLVEMMEWAKNHDEEARAISLNAQQFANDNLSFDRVFQYFYLLLLEYKTLQK